MKDESDRVHFEFQTAVECLIWLHTLRNILGIDEENNPKLDVEILNKKLLCGESIQNIILQFFKIPDPNLGFKPYLECFDFLIKKINFFCEKVFEHKIFFKNLFENIVKIYFLGL